MKKADIIEKLNLNIGIPKQEAERLTELFLEIMKETIEQGEDVKISGFGKFVVRSKRARRGRNPQTGDDLTITPRRVLRFQTSRLLKEALNGR